MSGCSVCADICPVEAIRISDNGVEITGECVDCGVCLSICPNSVFRLKERDDEKIISEIKDSGEKKGSTEFRISCQRGDAKADLLVQCLGRLTEAMLIEPIKAGISKVEILQPECGECQNSKASLHIHRIINRVLALYEMADIDKDKLIVKRIPMQSILKEIGKSISRRELLFSFRTKAVEVAAASIPDVKNKGDEHETFIEVINTRHDNFKRKLLIHALEGFSPMKEVFMPSEDAMLAEIEVSNRCTACSVCTTLCPTGALTQERKDEQFFMHFKPSLCTNCRVCVETCMPKAIRIKETVRLNYLLEDIEIKIFETRRKTCSICKIDFVQPRETILTAGQAAAGHDICPLCIDRHKKQMAFIQNGFSISKD
jgi:ferredoxin